MTWPEMIAIEPALNRLYRDAGALREVDDPYFCANWIWNARFEPRLLRLVGWDADHPDLRTEQAYYLAYDTIYAALPECRRCGCGEEEVYLRKDKGRRGSRTLPD